MNTKELQQMRTHECLDCAHKWAAPVVLADSAVGISGERREYCPHCGGKSVLSHPARMIDREYLKELARVAIAQRLNSWAALASLQIELGQCDGVEDVLDNFCAGLGGAMDDVDNDCLDRMIGELLLLTE